MNSNEIRCLAFITNTNVSDSAMGIKSYYIWSRFVFAITTFYTRSPMLGSGTWQQRRGNYVLM